MSKRFSKRHAPGPAHLRNDIPANVRARILAIFRQYLDGRHAAIFLDELRAMLVREYGRLSAAQSEAARFSDNPTMEHFMSCSDGEALDYIEMCFRTSVYAGGQDAVDQINAVFQEEGIAYDLTPYRGPRGVEGVIYFGPPHPEDQLPRVIGRDHQLIHETVIEPTLQLLGDPKLRAANDEMLRAHAALRDRQYEDAITLCGSAFESLLKTICEMKKWPYDPDRDTCATLVRICQGNNLFPSFYAPAFEGVGTIRNRLGDAHGRGPSPRVDVTKDHAEHMLHVVSSHMLFVAKCAGLG